MDTEDAFDVIFEPVVGEEDYMILRRQRQRVWIMPETLGEDYYVRGVLETSDPYIMIPI